MENGENGEGNSKGRQGRRNKATKVGGERGKKLKGTRREGWKKRDNIRGHTCRTKNLAAPP
jgi:hypothetical protein